MIMQNKSSFLQQTIGLAVILLITFAAAVVGALASAGVGDFYARLVLPAWAPPGWLFGPVWTVLYLLIAISAWLVWRKGGWRSHPAVWALFLAQLAANGLWTWLFFAWRLGGLAFLEIIVLWLLIVANARAFSRLHPWAGFLLLPYLAWVSFAAALAFAAWRLNPELL